jgi:hypothetical protein
LSFNLQSLLTLLRCDAMHQDSHHNGQFLKSAG